jgi:hypothetical protein
MNRDITAPDEVHLITSPETLEVAVLFNRWHELMLVLMLSFTAITTRNRAKRIQQLDILRQWWNLSQCSKPVDRRAAQLCYGCDIRLNGPVHANQLGASGTGHWP